MTFIFRNRTIFWDIPKWNRGQTKWDGGNITIGLHQESALSPNLFALVMDELTRIDSRGSPWCMIFVNDIVLADEIKLRVYVKLEIWKEESKCFQLN